MSYTELADSPAAGWLVAVAGEYEALRGEIAEKEAARASKGRRAH